MPRITKSLVDREQPTDRPRYIWDSDIKGFGLQVLPSGIKSFVYQYRTREGRERRMTLGKLDEAFTPDQARKRAHVEQETVRSGGDPLEQKRAARDSLTVGQMLDLYLESERFNEKAESTRAIDRGRINRHLRPLLGRQFVAKVSPDDVRRAFNKIKEGATAADIKTGTRGRAIVSGGEGTARMAVRLLRAVFTWAIAEKIAQANPAVDVKIGTDGTRDTVLEDASEYRTLFETLERLENEKKLRRVAADAIRVIALTGARRGEITNLRWRHVDLRRGLLTLPPKEHKTGNRTGKPREIGLPAAAQAIVARQAEGSPDAFVFPPAKGQGAITLAKPWRLVREEAGFPLELGLHGLRHSLATSMAMNGAEAAEIMTALGHRQLATAQRYVHWAQDARASLAERAAQTVTAGLREAAAEKTKPAKVRAVRGRHGKA